MQCADAGHVAAGLGLVGSPDPDGWPVVVASLWPDQHRSTVTGRVLSSD